VNPGIHENFFDLGGNSFLMIKVHRAIMHEFGRELSLIEMFRRPTIALQAQYFCSDPLEIEERSLGPSQRLVSRGRSNESRQKRLAFHKVN
jgi:hypothetical protein